MLEYQFSPDIKKQHSDARIGILEFDGINNAASLPTLAGRKTQMEASFREKYGSFTRPDFNELPKIAAYRAYYKQFKKSYHVQLQVESIALKGKDLPKINPLVDFNFMAEMETLLLTAGHDVDKLLEPVVFDVSAEGDEIIQLNGEIRPMRPGDMIMRDAEGVRCSIIYGQDNRSPISKQTSRVLYVTYAPPGISSPMVQAHHDLLKTYMTEFFPEAVLLQDTIIEIS